MKSSDIIKYIRSRLNLSQTELAEKLGVSFATVNRWEKGHRAPSQIALGIPTVIGITIPAKAVKRYTP